MTIKKPKVPPRKRRPREEAPTPEAATDLALLTAEAEIALSEDARRILESDVGTYFDGLSQLDIQEAGDKLIELDPYKYETLVALQNAITAIQTKAKQAQTLRRYFEETIMNGSRAVAELGQQEEPD